MIKPVTIKYDFTIINAVKSLHIRNINVRFLLTIDTKSPMQRTILVIMKNPSQATESNSDKTINNVITNLCAQYSRIYIMNLFPYYSTKANGLLSFLEDADHENILMINDGLISIYAAQSDDILLGWGTNTIGMKQKTYDDRIKEVMSIISIFTKPVFYVHCCSCAINPNGCGNNNNCLCRCKKNCKRTGQSNKHAIVRYPMHLELWAGNKQMRSY